MRSFTQDAAMEIRGTFQATYATFEYFDEAKIIITTSGNAAPLLCADDKGGYLLFLNPETFFQYMHAPAGLPISPAVTHTCFR